MSILLAAQRCVLPPFRKVSVTGHTDHTRGKRCELKQARCDLQVAADLIEGVSLLQQKDLEARICGFSGF